MQNSISPSSLSPSDLKLYGPETLLLLLTSPSEYSSLALPLEKALEREECENRIKTDYLGAINDIVTAVKNEKCVQVTTRTAT